jgi:hypothetical protein
MRKTLTARDRARLTIWLSGYEREYLAKDNSAGLAYRIGAELGLDITPDMARAALLAVYPELKKQPAQNTKAKELEREIADLRARLDKLTQLATGKLL